MNCFQCNKQLEEACPDVSTEQPYSGGYITLKFTYGSTKFDNCVGVTCFDGFICDNCAEKIVPKLTESHNDYNQI